MMKFAVVTAIAAALMATPSMAGQWGQRSEGVNVKNNVSSQSYSQSRSNARATGGNASSAANNAGNSQVSNFRDRLQAPGFGVGGGYCSNAASVSFPGGGFGFSFMERMCKTEVGARVAKTYLGATPAAQYVCSQAEFRNLTVCRGGRK